ncbi:hypothetical protein M8J77_008498 [Diaphorina citri]|nr:hypothetical protein M8J77_008498 [Diaphorina citri]
MLTEPILSHESEYPFPVVPTVLKLAGQGTSDSADSRERLVLYEPAHSGSITHLVDTIARHHIGTESCPEISIGPHIENSIVRFTTMLTEPILSHESEYPFPVVPTVLKLAGQGTSDSADSRERLVLYEPAHSGSITHLVDTIARHHIGKFSSVISIHCS